MKKLPILGHIGVFVTCLTLLSSCHDEPMDSPDSQLVKSKIELPKMDFYALSAGVTLDKYSTTDPEKILNSVSITGLMADERILAIDFRPATGQLYGLGSTSRLYVINQETGVARPIGTAPFTPTIVGDVTGFDFNPTVDRIRVVTGSGQNLRLNPETGTVAATDLPINGAPGAMIAAVAYSGNTAGSSATVLYDIDVNSNKLFKQLPPNNGTLVEVGDLGFNVVGEGGFDISYDQDIALGLFEASNKSTLFSIDLMTGNTVTLAKYPKTRMYTGIAIPTRPVAYAVSAANELLIFNPSMPSVVVTKPITGLAAGEMVLGIDMRPVNGQLFALGSTSRLYTINASSGAATAVGASTFSTPLSGTDFGLDFNPLVDRIRIVSNIGQNLRVNPNDGTVIVDLPLNPGTPAISAAAYANNFAGTTTTMLFDIDVNTDKLYLQSPPNNGTLVEIGSLGIDVEASTGFDIGGMSGIPYAILTSGGTTKIYEISKTTGMATAKGTFGMPVKGFTLGLGF